MPQPSRARVFISYKRHVEPDAPLAQALHQTLSVHHDVFLDQTTPVGTRWGERIDTALREADFLLVLLSAESVRSEMVMAEVEKVYYRTRTQAGHPTLLPVCLAYSDPLPYPLSAYLNFITAAFWSEPDDTPRLMAEVLGVIAGTPLSTSMPLPSVSPQPADQPMPQPAPIAPLEIPGGSLRADSKFYIERPADRVAYEAIAQQGVTLTIKGPRQMGKSSLLLRVVQTAIDLGKRVAVLDFQLFDRTTLHDDEMFFRHFCVWLSEELELENQVEAFWASPLGNPQRCTRYMGRYLLPALGAPLVLAMDEVDTIFDTTFRSDFFSMLRSWHNYRALQPIWRQLDLALVTSTEPYQFVTNRNLSPFNVGESLDLPDFMLEQMAELNQRHGAPLDADTVQRLFDLIGGDPFLVRRALYLVASKRLTPDELFAQAIEDHGPFGDHLCRHLFRLHEDRELLESLRQVLTRQTCPDERTFFRLHGAGLVRRDGRAVVPRLPLYAAYFGERLRG
jgi:AAA-like domain/TIR domain